MFAPEYRKRTIELSPMKKRRYKRQLYKWAKLYMKDFTRLSTLGYDGRKALGYKFNWPIEYAPILTMTECDMQYLTKPDTDFKYHPSELYAINMYLYYERIGMDEREVYQDFLYIKEAYINKIAARGFKKRPSWWVPKGRTDQFDS